MLSKLHPSLSPTILLSIMTSRICRRSLSMLPQSGRRLSRTTTTISNISTIIRTSTRTRSSIRVIASTLEGGLLWRESNEVHPANLLEVHCTTSIEYYPLRTTTNQRCP